MEQLPEQLLLITLHGEEREDDVDYIIKKASILSDDERAILGLTGIPSDWPIEQYVYIDSVPEGFEQISEDNLIALKSENQSAYDYWSLGKQAGLPLKENYKVEEYLSTGLIQSIKYYQDKVDDAYVNLSRTITYTYIDETINLRQIDDVRYDSVSGIRNHERITFYTDTETNKIITETEVL